MDSRLFDAARAGDTASLAQLVHDDPLILHQVTLAPSNSPLHVACLLAHADFANLVMQHNKDLALERNQQGFTPLHLAAAKGHLEIVKNLLRIDRELCRVKDQSGRIALHCAAIKGQTDVARELIEAYPETASERTPRGETLLHLAVINNQFEALEPLVGFLRDQNLDMSEFFNSQDEFGQTILHLAVELQNFQMVKLIVNETSGNVNLNATNSANSTPLDIAVTRKTVDGSIDSKDIEDVLRAALAGGGNYNRNQDHRIQIISGTSNQTMPNSSSSSSSSSRVDPKRDELSLNGIMVIAVLLATLSFQAALNPPGGVWQDWGSTRTDEVALASPPLAPVQSHSLPARIGLHIYNILAQDFSSDISDWRHSNVTNKNPHKPGKSISLELYARDFFPFIYACGLCFLLAISTLLLIPFRSYARGGWSNTLPLPLTVVTCSTLASVLVFLRGVALVTDRHVSIWVFVSVLPMMFFCVAAPCLVSWERKLKVWSLLRKKIASCCSRVKTPTWLTEHNVKMFVLPLICIFFSGFFYSARRN